MRSRWIALAAALAAVVCPVHGLDVVLAPLAVQDEGATQSERPGPLRPEVDLLRALEPLQVGDRPLVRRMNPASDSAPRSLLEAARLCEAHGYPQLLYGWLRRTEYALHAEVKLFDREAGEVVAVFFASDDQRHYERLVADVASKITAWFADEMGVAPRPAAERERNAVRLPWALGAWTALASDWARVTSGLAAVTVGARLVPVTPSFTAGARRGEIAIGLDLEYALGMNEPDYESFFLHMVRVRLTIQVDLEVARRHSLGVGLGPLLAIDTMAQDRLYDRFLVDTAAAAGASFILFYRYALSDRAALGFANVLDVAAYADPLVIYSPRLLVELRLPPAGGQRGGAQ